jgi:hypothetical protein
MFTPIKRALTALTITASLLTPISANAKYLTKEASKEALLRGRIISISESGRSFLIEYQGALMSCFVVERDELVQMQCTDDQPK